MQEGERADADASGSRGVGDLDVVRVLGQHQQERHPGGGSPDLQTREPRLERPYEAVAAAPVDVAGSNDVALVVASR